MAASSFLPFMDEQTQLARTKLGQSQIGQGQTMDVGTLARLIGIQRKWGWLAPAAQLSFAQAGFDAHSQPVQDSAQLDLVRRARSDQIQTQLGRIKTVDDLKAAEKSGALQGLSPDQQKQVGKQVTSTLLSGGGLDLSKVLDDIPVVGSVKALAEGKGIAAAATAAIPGYNMAQQLEGGASQGLNQATEGTPFGDVVKGATRTAGVVAAAPLEEAQGFIRNAAQGVENLAHGQLLTPQDPTTTPYLQSQAGQALESIKAGQPVDLGSGYLPSPESGIAKAAHGVQLQAGPTIGGHAFSLGRGLAAGLNEAASAVGAPKILEPDSTGFNIVSGAVDAGVAMQGDPTAAVLSNLSEGRAAARIFSPETEFASAGEQAYNGAGAFKSYRPFLAKLGLQSSGPTPTAYLDSPQGEGAMQWLADTKSPSQIVRQTGGKIPAITADGTPLAAMLAKADTPEDVKAIVRPFLGPDIQGPIKQPGGFTYGLKQELDAPAFGLVPSRTLNPQDKQASWTTLDGWLRTAHVDVNTRNGILDKYLNAQGGDQTFHALDAASDAVKQAVLAHGGSEERASELSRLFTNASDTNRMYAMDAATKAEMPHAGSVIDGQGNTLPSPQLTTEALNSAIELPDMRAVSRATSQFAPLLDSAPWRGSTAVMDQALSFWRGAHLLHPGLGVRILGDSQVSLAANGYDSMFSHPLNTVSAIVGGNLDKKWAQMLARMPGVNPSMAFDSLDAPMVAGYQEVENAIHGGFAAITDPRKVALSDFLPVSRDHPQAPQGLADELTRLGGDERVRGILQQPSPQAAKEWFWNGDGAAIREKNLPLADMINESNTARASALPGAQVVPLDLRSQAGSDQFVQDILDRVNNTTNGSPVLRDAITSGQVDGARIRTNIPGETNQDALDKLQTMLANGEGPDAVKARRTLLMTRAEAAADRQLKTHAFRWLFDHMAALPDAELDRIPAYQQAYWKRAAEYLPYVDNTPIKVGGEMTTARQLILDRAAENLPDGQGVLGGNMQDTLRRLEAAPIDEGARKLSLDQFHTLTQGAALDEIPRVVHDLSTRSKFFDMTRYLFPFGDAFRRIAQRWALTAWDHPNVLRRAQQGVTTARESGFFHVDPTTGSEVFTYPGSQFLTDKLIGVPVPLTGQVEGLSMVGNGLPGIGPAVSIPAQYFLPDTPQFDDLRNVIFPQGQPLKSPAGIVGDVAQSLEPAWADKLQAGLTDQYHDQKGYNTIVGQIMRYEHSTGHYDLNGPNAAQEADRMLSDAKQEARWFYVVRGLAQSISPSAPTPQWNIVDKSGHLAQTDVAVNDYRNQQTKVGPDKAMDWLVNTYGSKNIFVAQPFSKPIVYGVPVTKEGHDWANAHDDVRSAYPNTYGFFAPQTDSNGKPLQFDITAFEDQFVRGERTSLKPEDFAANANNRAGMWIYHKQRDKIIESNGGEAPDQGQNAWLSQLKTALMQHYPGFNLIPYDDKKLPRTVSELIKASGDQKLAGTDAQQGLKDYLGFRQQAIDAYVDDYGHAAPKPGGILKAGNASPLRAWLRSAGAAVVKQHPDFGPMWDQVLSHEFPSAVATGAP